MVTWEVVNMQKRNNVVTIQDIPFSIKPSDVIKSMQMKKVDPSFGVSEKIENLLKDVVLPNAKPKAMYKPVFVEAVDENKINLEDVSFHSRLLYKNLEKTGKVFVYIVTAGVELDRVKLPGTDFLSGFYLDGIKEVILEQAALFLEQHIKQKHLIESVAHMNPGSLSEWPISNQKKIFELLENAGALIGVELSSSLLLNPIKSISGICFPTEIDFKSCMLCTRQNCRKRRAKYNPEMASQYKD